LAGSCSPYNISVVAADAFINCRVNPDIKARVRTLAQRDGVTESALVKQLLEVLLRSTSLGSPPLPTPSEPVNRNARLCVRLQPEDWRLLRERADARRIPAATYVSHLVRSHLRGAAPLPKAEYLALRQSIAELATIGRNLNQIARVLNEGGRAPLPGQPEVGAMLKVAVSLRDHFRALLTANERSWTAS
jgi:Bacterial mobilisation protein (MobC)